MSEQSRYPQWQIDMFRASTGGASKADRDVLEGRSIVENDAIQAEHRETRRELSDDGRRSRR